MTERANDTPKPRSAILLAICILTLLGAETYWLYRWHRSNEELSLANIRRAGENALDLRKIMDLRAAAGRIDGLYLRLQDPLPTSPPSGQQLSSLVSNGVRHTDPAAIQDFVKAGLVAVPSGAIRSEASIGYDLGTNQLEFHRLVPLIAQEENSHPFFFIDHIELIRPKTTEPFSLRPTALQTKFTARMFSWATR
jgi:hypothetical protein